MYNKRRPSCAPEMHRPKKGSLVLFPGAFCSGLLLIFLMWNLSSFSYGLGTENSLSFMLVLTSCLCCQDVELSKWPGQAGL